MQVTARAARASRFLSICDLLLFRRLCVAGLSQWLIEFNSYNFAFVRSNSMATIRYCLSQVVVRSRLR